MVQMQTTLATIEVAVQHGTWAYAYHATFEVQWTQLRGMLRRNAALSQLV